MLIQKREKNVVNSSEMLTDSSFATCPVDHRLEAISCIECAIEHLAELSDCPDCLESIGNLSIVLMDLKAE